jgi:hypothetical protein
VTPNARSRVVGRTMKLGRLCLLALTGIALAPLIARAQSTADKRLEDYIALTIFASPYATAQRPEQWCYYAKPDRTYNWWYLIAPGSGALAPLRTFGGFGIPFSVTMYGKPQNSGAIVVGYVIDPDRLIVDLQPFPPFSASATDCAIGLRILADSPYPITGLAADLALETETDPASEYRYWSLSAGTYAVRSILAIPASFQVGGKDVAGRVIVAFGAKLS